MKYKITIVLESDDELLAEPEHKNSLKDDLMENYFFPCGDTIKSIEVEKCN